MIDMSERRKSSTKVVENLSLANVFILATGIESLLTEESPKCLLKVANKPILAYQLEFLERNKINEINIITNRKFYQKISDYLYGEYRGNVKFEILTTNKSLESLELFQFIKSKITMNNFIVISGDSILDFKINSFMDHHILNESLVSLLLCKDEQKFANQRLKHLNSEIEVNIFGLHGKSEDSFKQLVYHSMFYDDNQTQNEEKIKISKKLLTNCPDFDLVYNFDDVHFYMFNRKIYNLLDDEKVKKLSLIKTDLIPFLINNQFNRKLRNLVYFGKEEENERVSNLNVVKKPRLEKIKVNCQILEGKNYVYRITNLSKLLNTLAEFQKNVEEIPRIYFSTKNNIRNVFEVHSDQITKNINGDRPYFEGLDYIESITLDSLVADPVVLIAKKSRINKSVVGANLNIEVNSKLNNSLLFDNVKIGKDCTITNCIIAENVTIDDGCSLTDCVILPQCHVEAKSKFTTQTIGGDNDLV